MLEQFNVSQKMTFAEFKPKEVYDTLEAMRRSLKDSSVNHSILYEPKQGDLVFVKATLNHYKYFFSLFFLRKSSF